MAKKATKLKVICKDGMFLVPSETQSEVIYEIHLGDEGGSCTCPAGERGVYCKHKRAVVRYLSEQEVRKEAELVGDVNYLPFDSGNPQEGEKGMVKKGEPKTIKLGFRFDEVTSALQKEIRRGNEENAVYWSLILHDAAPQYVWKRVLIIACEDIGLAAPEVVSQVYSLACGWKMAREGTWYLSPHALTMAVMALCRAPKSTEVEDLQTYTILTIKDGKVREMPSYAIDYHTKAGREMKKDDAFFYGTRHVTFGIPLNKYTKKLAELKPEWFNSTVTEILQNKTKYEQEEKS